MTAMPAPMTNATVLKNPNSDTRPASQRVTAPPVPSARSIRRCCATSEGSHVEGAGFLPEAASSPRGTPAALAGQDGDPSAIETIGTRSTGSGSNRLDRRLQLVPELAERVCVEPRCDVVLVGRRPEARYCSQRCRKRAEWSRLVARERARQAAQAATQAAEHTTGPARLDGEPWWSWELRTLLAQSRTGEAADLWRRAVELSDVETIPAELARLADELGWSVPRRWSS